jgi:hypothetical protein
MVWLGLLVVVGFFAFITWRNQTFKPIPSLIVAVQVAFARGPTGYAADRLIA